MNNFTYFFDCCSLNTDIQVEVKLNELLCVRQLWSHSTNCWQNQPKLPNFHSSSTPQKWIKTNTDSMLCPILPWHGATSNLKNWKQLTTSQQHNHALFHYFSNIAILKSQNSCFKTVSSVNLRDAVMVNSATALIVIL